MTAMRLIVLSAGLSERHFEVYSHHGDHETPESADAALASMTTWREAQLCVRDPRSDDGWTCSQRRLPTTPWRAVLRWTERPRHGTDPISPDIDAISAWLRDMGVRLAWSDVLVRMWPGHERGEINADSLEPDRMFRSGADHGEDALEYVVGLIVNEGQDSGALWYRLRTNVDELRASYNRVVKETEEQAAEIRALRNEVRRLKGEPEISEEEERAAVQAKVREYLDRRKRGRQ